LREPEQAVGEGAAVVGLGAFSTSASATASDATSAMDTVRANGRNSSPAMPPTIASGMKTATAVIVDEVTAAATSRTARRISGGPNSSPRPTWRSMFSITTIESSTTRPTATVRPDRVSRLRL